MVAHDCPQISSAARVFQDELASEAIADRGELADDVAHMFAKAECSVDDEDGRCGPRPCGLASLPFRTNPSCSQVICS